MPRAALLTAMLIVVFPAGVSAQSAQLSGRVTDATSAALRGALVTVTQTTTGISRAVVSNEQGIYTLAFLSPASYRVTVTATGFAPTHRDIVLLVDDARRLDFELPLADLQEAMDVHGDATLARREGSSIGRVFQQPAIVGLPLNGRNYAQLALLVAGAVPNPGARVRADGVDLNGNRAPQNTFLIDGLDNNNYLFGAAGGTTQAIRPSADAIEEFRVETANYTSEQGGTAGGVISVVIKSGSNTFHGSGFEFFRHERLEANDFFARRGGLVKPPLRYHQFGGTAGGPIIRNRAFFFASYQGTRERRTYTSTATVPSRDMINGSFGLVPIYDPENLVDGVRQPFPNNTIPAERIDPVGRRIAELFAAPNRAGVVENFVGVVARTDNRHQIDVRVDVHAATGSHLFARFSQSNVDITQGSLFGGPGNGFPNLAALGDAQQLPLVSLVDGSSFVLGHTQVISSTAVNEVRAGYSANANNQRSPAPRPLFDDFGIRGIPAVPGLTGLPSIDVIGFGVIGDRSQLPFHANARTVQVGDTVAWSHGSHIVKVGGETRFKRNGIDNVPQGNGQFTFTGQFTSQIPGQPGGSGLADLLLGQTSVARLSTALRGDFRDRYFAVYANDTWKIASNLTVTLGARYDVQTPMWEAQNRLTNFDADPPSPTFGTLRPAMPGNMRARTFADLDLNNVAPRVGANWQVSRTTAVRGAYGLFFGGVGFQAAALTGLANVPYFVRTTIPSPSSGARSRLVLADGFRADALDPVKAASPDGFSLAPDQRMGEVRQWNVSIERQLLADTSLSVTYVGSASSHLRGIDNINAPTPGNGSIQARRPFPAFGEILEASTFVEGSYHALQVTADHRIHRGLAALVTYTWGHAIDNASDTGDTATPITPQNRTDIESEKASAIFDVRHRLATSVTYQSADGSHPLLRRWQLAGILVAQTGYPLTPTIRPNPAISTTVLRPDCIGDAGLPRSARNADRWFDVSAFQVPAPFTFGNCGRNVLRGPGYVNLDLLVGRGFMLAGATRIELRAEIFNVVNAVHLGPPNTVIDIPDQAGRITSTQAPPRQAQLAVRYIF